MRVAKVIVHEEDDDFANDIVYCSITSETMAGSEIRVTPMTPNLDQGEEFAFGIESGILWGQQGPRTPGGNMLFTYDCFESDTNDGYKNLVDSIAAGADKVGGVAGDNGWIFTTVGAVAPILGSAVALDGESGAARRELAQAALLIGNAALAEENLALLRAREEDDELLLLSARARRLLGDPPGALALLQRIRAAIAEHGRERVLLDE